MGPEPTCLPMPTSTEWTGYTCQTQADQSGALPQESGIGHKDSSSLPLKVCMCKNPERLPSSATKSLELELKDVSYVVGW